MTFREWLIPRVLGGFALAALVLFVAAAVTLLRDEAQLSLLALLGGVLVAAVVVGAAAVQLSRLLGGWWLMARRGYRISRVESVFDLSNPEGVVEHSRVTLAATRRASGVLVEERTWTGTGEPGELDAVSGRIIGKARRGNATVYAIDVGHQLERGERASYELRQTHLAWNPPEPFVVHVVDSPVEELVIRLRFLPQAMPPVDRLRMIGRGARAQLTYEPDTGSAELTVKRPRIAERYGISWAPPRTGEVAKRQKPHSAVADAEASTSAPVARRQWEPV